MKDKCQKFEGLFVFSDEETLKKHIEECPDCAEEARKMEKVSELLQEVRPYFVKKRKHFAALKVACAISFILFAGTIIGVTSFNQDVNDMLKYGTVLEASDLGLPVDDYGLILVE